MNDEAGHCTMNGHLHYFFLSFFSDFLSFTHNTWLHTHNNSHYWYWYIIYLILPAISIFIFFLSFFIEYYTHITLFIFFAITHITLNIISFSLITFSRWYVTHIILHMFRIDIINKIAIGYCIWLTQFHNIISFLLIIADTRATIDASLSSSLFFHWYVITGMMSLASQPVTPWWLPCWPHYDTMP